MTNKLPRNFSKSATSEIKAAQRQTRSQTLHQSCDAVMKRGQWPTFFRDIAECYSQLQLTPPKALVIAMPTKERASEVRDVLLGDKRIRVVADSRVAEGEAKLLPVFQGDKVIKRNGKG
jgi:hypothetical protein